MFWRRRKAKAIRRLPDQETKVRSLPDHESAVRSFMAESRGESYVAMRTLDEAKAVPDGVVILEGDYGGHIYVVVPARLVKCSKHTLESLLRDLDAEAWPGSDSDAAQVFYERGSPGSGVWGGTGGGAVIDGVWVHEKLSHLQAAIEDVIAGRAESIADASPT